MGIYPKPFLSIIEPSAKKIIMIIKTKSINPEIIENIEFSKLKDVRLEEIARTDSK